VNVHVRTHTWWWGGRWSPHAWWLRIAKQRRCFHHDIRDGASFIVELGIIDYRKAWECRVCNKIWIL
jgi:hypothetical protein